MKQKELSLRQNMLWNSVGSFINMLCQWLITVVVVRVSNGYDAAGLYSLAVAVYGIFNPIAQYRMYTYQISDMDNENSVGEYLSFRLITNTAAFILCFGYALITCPVPAIPTILLFAIYKLLSLVLDVFHASMQRHYRMDYIGISLSLQGLVSLVLFTIVFAWSRSVNTAVLCMAIAVCVIGVVYVYPRVTFFERITLGISFQKVKTLALRCAPLVLAAIASSASGAVPRQFLVSLSGEASLGIYASIAAPVAIIPTMSSYIYYPLISRFAEKFQEGDILAFRSLFFKVTAAIFAVGLLCALLFVFFGEKILAFVFGNGIEKYIFLLQPLVFASMVSAYMWFLNDLLIAVRDIKGDFWGGIIVFAVALSVTVPLVHFFGMNGVSFVVMVASIVGSSFMCMRIYLNLQRLQLSLME